MNHKRRAVLIVEDSESWQRNLSAYVKKAGGEPVVAANLGAVQDEVRKRCFDVAIVDLGLDPENDENRDGYRAVQKIRGYGRGIHGFCDGTAIVVVTAHYNADEAKKSLKGMDVDEFLGKATATEEEYVKWIKSAFDKRRSVRGKLFDDIVEVARPPLAVSRDWERQLEDLFKFPEGRPGISGLLRKLLLDYVPIVHNQSPPMPCIDLKKGVLAINSWSRGTGFPTLALTGRASSIEECSREVFAGGSIAGLTGVTEVYRESMTELALVVYRTEQRREVFHDTKSYAIES